jgi:hypothetical protein
MKMASNIQAIQFYQDLSIQVEIDTNKLWFKECVSDYQ